MFSVTFGDNLYFTRDIPEEKWIPKKLDTPPVAKSAPKPAPKRGKQPAVKPAAASSSISVANGQHVQQCGTVRGNFTTSLFSNRGSRGRQITGEWVLCIVDFTYLHHVHGTTCIPKPWTTYNKRLINHEFCMVCAGK